VPSLIILGRPEEWLLLNSRQKTLHREVMVETCRVIASLGKDVYAYFNYNFYCHILLRVYWLTLNIKFCCLIPRASIYLPIHTYIIHIYTCYIHTRIPAPIINK
uniref:KRAB domain-containing protein n=1 Tax=Pseudonaja textilis TaxID=8673 RepID=A0A670YZ23_PSETE